MSLGWKFLPLNGLWFGSMSPQIPPGGAHVRHSLNTALGSFHEGQVASCGAGLENPIRCRAPENTTRALLF